MENIKTVAVNLGIVAILAVILFWGNTLYRQHLQFDKGEAGLKAGDFVTAVAGYEAAIHMYTPGSSVVETAAQRLWEIGESCEQRGDAARALVAYRSLRSSFYAVASFYSPGTGWIEKTEARIAELVKQQH